MNQALNPAAAWPLPIGKAEAFRIVPPPLAEGETYIGLIGNAAGEAHHVILLPGDNDEANHEAALEWAKSIGGDLPTRIEQAMLWANHKDLFQKDWYWSNETHSADPVYAWCQYFDYGNQLNTHKGYELRARAVRRLIIE
jgi:hypothetical protein